MTKNKRASAKAPSNDADYYTYSVAWSDEDQVFIGRVAEFSLLSAHGKTAEAALKEIRLVVLYVLEDLKESNEPIPEPFSKRRYSGKLVLRMPPQKHRELAIEAEREGVSLNLLVNKKLGAA
jgi:predicted HicB family RNase H-like nuclease